ncbi:MAG: tetratricopeptide repeat protein [Acidobacteria bacterium]|nr:MAG: tetratricopeptide repeat protein [Acidobacteriota bacterium]
MRERSALLFCAAIALSAPAAAAAAEEDLVARALKAVDEGRYVRARELAAAILTEDPDSAVGEFVLALALHRGEGYLPIALRHYRRARALAEGPAHRPRPGFRELHERILANECVALADLGLYEELLRANALYRELYDPERFSADVWPLMKLGRIDQARRAIAKALATGDPFEEIVARNGECALDGYEACLAMLEAVQRVSGLSPGLALRNAAVSALMVGHLDEAERLLVESTAHPEDDADPWRDLTDLYLAEGRLGEAVEAARRMIEFGRRMPPRQRQYVRAEQLVSAGQLLLLAGHPERALAAVSRAIAQPDRASHWSGTPEEIRAEGFLLHRAVLLDLAERAEEEAALEALPRSLAARLRAWRRRVEAWLAGRRLMPLLLRGGLRLREKRGERDRPELSGPSWLTLDAVALLGPGPTRSLVAEQRARDPDGAGLIPHRLREGLLDALECEAAALAGKGRAALRAGRAAREELPRGLRLLRARLAARMAEAAWESAGPATAAELFAEVLETDPGALRRLGISLPVRPGKDPAVRRLLSTPRFHAAPDSPFALESRGERVCLSGPGGSLLGCGSGRDDAARARALLDAVFAPRIDLSQQDLETLDGTPVVARDLDRDLLDELTGPAERSP